MLSLAFLLGYVLLLLLCLIPSWIGLAVYDHLAVQLGWHVLDITFVNVLCVAIALTILRSIFYRGK